MHKRTLTSMLLSWGEWGGSGEPVMHLQRGGGVTDGAAMQGEVGMRGVSNSPV